MDPRLRLVADIVQVAGFILLIFGLVAVVLDRRQRRRIADAQRSRVTSRELPPRAEPRPDPFFGAGPRTTQGRDPILELGPHPLDNLMLGIADGLRALGRRAWDHRRYDEVIDDDDDAEDDVAPPVAATSREALHGVATPQNERNALLHVAEDAKLEALAALMLESRAKAFQNGEVPETRALKALFGASPSSATTSEYQRLKRRLHAIIDRLEQPAESHVTPIAQRPTSARFDP